MKEIFTGTAPGALPQVTLYTPRREDGVPWILSGDFNLTSLWFRIRLSINSSSRSTICSSRKVPYARLRLLSAWPGSWQHQHKFDRAGTASGLGGTAESGVGQTRELFELTHAKTRRLIVRQMGEARRTVVDNASQLAVLGILAFDYTLDVAGGFETFHAKVALADNELAYIGSANIRPASRFPSDAIPCASRVAEPVLPRQTATIHIGGEHPNIYLGAAVGPFGLLSMTVDEAGQTAETLPEILARQIRFVGMDIDVVRQLRDKSLIEPRVTLQMSDGTSIGPDGLLFRANRADRVQTRRDIISPKNTRTLMGFLYLLISH